MWYWDRYDPVSGGTERFVVGIYHHPVPPDIHATTGLKSYPVKATWSKELAAFVSSYIAKSALWLRKLPLE